MLFSGGSYGKESACNAGDQGLTPGSGRSPRERNGSPFQYSCLQFHGQKSLAGYTPPRVCKSQGCKKSNTTERQTLFLFPLRKGSWRQ